MKTETKKTPCDGTRHAGPCSGGDWDPCTIPKGPRGYASRLRDGNLTDEDHEYEASLEPTETHDEMVRLAYASANQPINIALTFSAEEEGDNYIQMCEALAGETWETAESADEFSAVNLTLNSLEREVKTIERALDSAIESLGRRLAEAQEAIQEGRTPNTCGIVQGLGNDIDMKVARLDQAKTNLANFKAAISHDANREIH